jgi:plastocyanin
MPDRRPLKLAALVLITLAAPSRAATHTVTVGPDLGFHPLSLTIAAGDTVVWTNAGGTHDVHADDNGFFNSPSPSDWTFSHTFTAAGTVGYHCTIHGRAGLGMYGEIIVEGESGIQPGTLRFGLDSSSVGEGGGAATVTVERANGDDGAVSVQYGATNGTATAGQDFTAVSGTLHWEDGDASPKTFSVPVLDDATDEANETVFLALSNPTGGAVLDPVQQTATLTLLDDDPPGGGGSEGFLTTPAFPGFRFRLRIYQGADAFLFGRKEDACLPETLCVSGAVPGRSEVFVRILGPRPNGFLWPTVVRFTPSRVVVEIQQTGTGLTRSYDLPAVPADSDSLSGLQDRMGFLP